jgi:mitogen-activated protein kinase kinase kinase
VVVAVVMRMMWRVMRQKVEGEVVMGGNLWWMGGRYLLLLLQGMSPVSCRLNMIFHCHVLIRVCGRRPAAETALTERELLAICQSSLDDPIRARGLTVRRLKKLGNRKDIEGFFGEVVPATTVISPTSPLYMASSRITMPREWEEPQQPQQQAGTTQGKRLNRASMSSVMSALGVNVGSAPSMPALSPTPESQYSTTPAPTSVAAAPKSPSSGSFLASRGKKMYNFFGHRPPSELISTHLADYFPSAKRKDLERGYRNSVLRFGNAGGGDASSSGGGNRSSATSVGGLGDSNRASYASSRTSSLENQLPSRFSIASSSSSSGAGNRASRISPGEGDVSASSHYDGSPSGPDRSVVPRVAVSTGSDGNGSASDDPGRPTSESYGASEDSQPGPTAAQANHHRSRRNSALSTKSRMSTFRPGRRKSETPSMLTVDEITAEFEQRRASVITFAESEQEAEDAANRFSVPAAPGLGIGLGNRASKAFRGSVLMPQAESEEEWAEDSLEEEEETSERSEEDDVEEEEQSDEEEEEEEIEDEQGKAFTSTGCESVSRCFFLRHHH